MKPNKIIDLYETACEFTKLCWASKFSIGNALCILEDNEWNLANDELEELVFTRAAKEGMFLRLKEEIIHFKEKEALYDRQNSRKVFN